MVALQEGIQMINFVEGNILETACDVLVVPTNTKGVAGAGLALAVRQAYPDWYKAYVNTCKGAVEASKPLKGGDLIWYETGNAHIPNIVSLMTKEDWRFSSKMDWVSKGLDFLVSKVDGLPYVNLINVPLLGCGKGNLNPDNIKTLMRDKLDISSKLFRIYSR